MLCHSERAKGFEPSTSGWIGGNISGINTRQMPEFSNINQSLLIAMPPSNASPQIRGPLTVSAGGCIKFQGDSAAKRIWRMRI